jgi:hypothetical protein
VIEMAVKDIRTVIEEIGEGILKIKTEIPFHFMSMAEDMIMEP